MIWFDLVLLAWAAAASWLAVEGWQKFRAERAHWRGYIEVQAELRELKAALGELLDTSLVGTLNDPNEAATAPSHEAVIRAREALTRSTAS